MAGRKTTTTSDNASASSVSSAKSKGKNFKLPRYLRLAKGSMWFDTEGDKASGAKVFSANKVFVGRGENETEEGIPKDQFNNNNFVDYGYIVDESLPWYIDTSKIDSDKMSRIIIAYKHRILVEADPENPPVPHKKDLPKKDFAPNKQGELVFVGTNKEMFRRLQRSNFAQLREWVNSSPKTETVKNNLIDMFHYEQNGYNPLSRPRLEVLDLIRDKLKEFGPSMSAIRINED